MRATISKLTTFVNRRSDTERLVLVVTEPVTDVILEMQNEGERASVVLSAEEVGKLGRWLECMASRRRTGVRERSETIEGDDGSALVLTRTNWGEPYDEGASFSLRGSVDMRVEMPDSELYFLRTALAGLAADMEANAEPGRGLR